MKRLFSLMLVLVLILGLAVSASAATEQFVYDDADLNDLNDHGLSFRDNSCCYIQEKQKGQP